MIAYSSIENSGLIVTGFGVALTGAAVGDRRLVTVGLLAATLQMVAHTIAKSLLFTSVAGIEAAGGSDDLEDLRRRARRTPWSCFGLLGTNIRPVPVTWDDRRGTVVRHDGQPCPSACST